MASLAIVGVLAALLVLTWNPMVTEAHGGGTAADHCSDINNIAHDVAAEIAETTNADGSAHTCANPSGATTPDTGTPDTGTPDTGTTAVTMLKSSSTSGGASVKLTLTIVNLPEDLNSGSWVEIYLEDDYQEPGSISRQDVVFIATNADGTGDPATNDGGTVTAAAVEIDDGGEIGNPDPDKEDDEDAVVISARIPDMDPRDDSFGYPVQGQTLMMIVSSSAEIENPTEAKSNSTGYAIVRAGEDRGDVADVKLTDLLVKAKIGLSADDGGRGKAVTVTGSGFNNGTEATVYVLALDSMSPMDGEVSDAEFWNALNCYEMNQAVGQMGDDMDDEGEGFCQMYDDLSSSEMATVDGLDYTKGAPGEALCSAIVRSGESLGTDGVDSAHKFEVEFTVHDDEFDAGEVNYICAADNESPSNRLASAVKTFDLTPSLTISPDSVSSGEEVTLKPRDFNSGTIEVSLDGDEDATYPATAGDDFEIEKDGSNYVFDMPGGLSDVVQVSFKQGGDTKRGTITVDPANLKLSKTEVAPNETIIISGSGFSENSHILVKNIKLDGKSMAVDDAGTADGYDDPDEEGTQNLKAVRTTSSGGFTATVSVWAMGEDNPALDDDDYTIKATDAKGFVGKAKITILEPTVSVMPEMVSPRDFITISGENWPISTSDDDHEVTIMVDRRNRSVNIDGNGRFRYQYQLRSNIGIGDEHEVVVEFESDGGSIEEEATFEVHDAGIMLTPTEAAPGQTISLEVEGMPPYALVDHVNIDGVNRLGGQNLNTDRHGNVMITGVLVPYLDPGFYPVEVMVGEQTRVVQLEVLAEAVVAGVAAALPGAVEDLGDNLVRIFHFNTSSKVWTFYDPRPEFEGLNTLTELAAGQPYWILVPETQENVVLNGRPRDLTCVGGDCWNQLVW